MCYSPICRYINCTGYAAHCYLALGEDEHVLSNTIVAFEFVEVAGPVSLYNSDLLAAIWLNRPHKYGNINCSYSAWVGWGVRSAGGDRLICDESRGVLFSLV